MAFSSPVVGFVGVVSGRFDLCSNQFLLKNANKSCMHLLDVEAGGLILHLEKKKMCPLQEKQDGSLSCIFVHYTNSHYFLLHVLVSYYSVRP